MSYQLTSSSSLSNEQTTADSIMQTKLSKGQIDMMKRENEAAEWSSNNGLYITYQNTYTKNECFRIGPNSLCFCSHTYSDHARASRLPNPKCGNCKCKHFEFIPQSPEGNYLFTSIYFLNLFLSYYNLLLINQYFLIKKLENGG